MKKNNNKNIKLKKNKILFNIYQKKMKINKK
jgi:hypothetical protein